MGVNDINYQIVKRDESLLAVVDDGRAFLHCLKEYNGGFKVCRTDTDTFISDIERLM